MNSSNEKDPTNFDRKITDLCEDFAHNLDALATGDFLREGVLRQAISTLVWAIADRMSDQREALADALEHFPDLIREEVSKV
jgi:hypothetical protein